MEILDNQKIKITFLAGYYEPDVSADSHLNSSLCNGLSNRGYDVTVVAPFPCRGIDEDTRIEFLNRKRETNEYGVKIFRTGTSKFHNNIFARGIDFIYKTYKLYETAKNIPTDLYIIMSTPPFLGLLGKFFPKASKKIYRLQDIFPDNVVNVDITKEGSFLFNVLKVLEKNIYKNNDLIVTVSKDMCRLLSSRGIPNSKLAVVYNWIDENKCYYISRHENFLFDKYSIDRKKFIALYAGNIGHMQQIDTIVYAANILKNNNDIFFAIVGDGACKQKIETLIKELNLQNIKIYPLQPMKLISYVYSLGDVGLVSLKSGVSKFALPSKTWSVMSASRPVICEIDDYSEMNDIIRENDCGFTCLPKDAKTMAEDIVKLYNNEKLKNYMGENSRKFILKMIRQEAGIDEFCKIINKCMEAK